MKYIIATNQGYLPVEFSLEFDRLNESYYPVEITFEGRPVELKQNELNNLLDYINDNIDKLI